MNREPEGDGKGGRQTLVSTGWLFAGGSAIHVVDHLRRGQGSVTEELYWLGTTALVMQVVLVVLAVTRHRLAPLVAVAIGYPLALGFLAAHCCRSGVPSAIRCRRSTRGRGSPSWHRSPRSPVAWPWRPPAW